MVRLFGRYIVFLEITRADQISRLNLQFPSLLSAYSGEKLLSAYSEAGEKVSHRESVGDLLLNSLLPTRQ